MRTCGVYLALWCGVAAAQQAAPTADHAPPSAAAQFDTEVQLLFRMVACGDSPVTIEAQDAQIVEEHCAQMRKRYDVYRATWVTVAQPFIQSLKPAGLPTTIVYPFGGGDLLSALTTYPEAKEITTMSLEHGGDPRRIIGLHKEALRRSLEAIRSASAGLLVANDSKTENLMKVQRGELPGQLSFFLMALAVHGYVPVSLKYFALGSDGNVQMLSQEQIPAAQLGATGKKAALLHSRWVSPDFAEQFSNLELTFRRANGSPDGGQLLVHRHIAANLDDAHFAASPNLLNYLRQRSRVSAMTKAASYLLWRDNFSTIRSYLLESMAFMVSDSTGIPPQFARAAGFEQRAFGTFHESFLGANANYNQQFRELWKGAPPLSFRYGYLDKLLHKHLLVTQRKP